MSLPRLWLAVLGLVLAAVTVSACPFCSEERGPTLVGDFAQASMVLYGHMENDRLTSKGDSATDFVIEQVLKPHEAVKDKKLITLQRKVPPTKAKFLLFCDVYKGAIDPY